MLFPPLSTPNLPQLFEVNMYYPLFMERQPRHQSINFKYGSTKSVSWNSNLSIFYLEPTHFLFFGKLLTNSQFVQISVFVWNLKEVNDSGLPTSNSWRAQERRSILNWEWRAWHLMEAIASDLRHEGQGRKGSGWGQGRERPASTASSAPRQQVPLKSVLVLRGSMFLSLSLVRREAAGNLRGPAYKRALSASHAVVVPGPALNRACRAGGRGPGQLRSRPPGPTIPRVCEKAPLPVSAAWELPEEVMAARDRRSTKELAGTVEGSSPPPCPCNMRSAHYSHSLGLFRV